MKHINDLDLNLHRLLNAVLNPMTQAQIAALTLSAGEAGFLVYNITESRFEYWDGAAWQQVGSSYSLPVAGSNRGGIKAADKGAGDTVEAKIDPTTEKLFVPAYPTVPSETDPVFTSSPAYNISEIDKTAWNVAAGAAHNRKHSITGVDDHEFPAGAHGDKYLRQDGAFATPPQPTVPVKATGAEINAGTNDANFATPKSIQDSNIFRAEKAGQVAALPEKSVFSDGDIFPFEDSQNAGAWKFASWLTVKNRIKVFTDTLYNFLALGSTSTTAHRGDHGAAAYNHSITTHAPTNADNTQGAINAASEKQDLVDADSFAIEDSEASGAVKVTTWSNIKSKLTALFNTLYQAIILAKTGKKITPHTANDYLEVVTDEDTAITGQSTKVAGKGLKGIAAMGTGVDGEGLVGGRMTGSNIGLEAIRDTNGTDNILAIANFIRKSSQTAAAGFGAYIPIFLQNSAGSTYEAFRLQVKQTTATAGSVSTEVALYGWRNGTWEVWVTISQTGALTFHNYGAGNITGTVARIPALATGGAMIEILPEELQKEYRATDITGAAAYIGKSSRYNRTTHCNHTTDIQLVLKVNELAVGEFYEFYQANTGKALLLREVIEITGATSPTAVNARYYISGTYNSKDAYYNAIANKRIWWETDRWKVGTTLGGSADFERVNASPIGAYTAVNGSGTPTAADIASQLVITGAVASQGINSRLRVICTDATSNANKYKVEAIAHEAVAKIPEFIRTVVAATYTIVAADIGNIVTINRATDVTVTIPTQLMAAKQAVGFEIIGAGQLILEVADGAKQAINTAKKSPGQDSFMSLYCRDHTVNAEIYKVIGGVA